MNIRKQRKKAWKRHFAACEKAGYTVSDRQGDLALAWWYNTRRERQ